MFSRPNIKALALSALGALTAPNTAEFLGSRAHAQDTDRPSLTGKHTEEPSHPLLDKSNEKLARLESDASRILDRIIKDGTPQQQNACRHLEWCQAEVRSVAGRDSLLCGLPSDNWSQTVDRIKDLPRNGAEGFRIWSEDVSSLAKKLPECSAGEKKSLRVLSELMEARIQPFEVKNRASACLQLGLDFNKRENWRIFGAKKDNDSTSYQAFEGYKKVKEFSDKEVSARLELVSLLLNGGVSQEEFARALAAVKTKHQATQGALEALVGNLSELNEKGGREYLLMANQYGFDRAMKGVEPQIEKGLQTTAIGSVLKTKNGIASAFLSDERGNELLSQLRIEEEQEIKVGEVRGERVKLTGMKDGDVRWLHLRDWEKFFREPRPVADEKKK